MKRINSIILTIMCLFLFSACGTDEISKEKNKLASKYTNMTIEYDYYEDKDGDAAQFYALAAWEMDDGQKIVYDVDEGTYQKEDGTVVGRQTIQRADKHTPGVYMLEIFDEASIVHIYSKWVYFTDLKEGKVKGNKILSPAKLLAKDPKKDSYNATFDEKDLIENEEGNWVWDIGVVDHGNCMGYAIVTEEDEATVARADEENPITIDISWDEKQLKKPDDVFISLNLSYTGSCKEIKSEIVGRSEVYSTDDGTQLVTIQYDEDDTVFHHVAIHIWNQNVNMDVDWSSGKDNGYAFAGCKVLTAYEGNIIDIKDETNALSQDDDENPLLGICSVRMGIYCPYDPSWDPTKITEE